MADSPTLVKLINRLIKLTEENKVEWAETGEAQRFLAAFPQYTVSISKKYAGQNWGEDYYEYPISVSDASGKVLEEASDSGLVHAEFPGYQSSQDAMKFLYEQARRKALKVDEALSDLLSSLDSRE